MTTTSFSLFGLGRDGIPKGYQRLLRTDGGPEKLARAIIEECQADAARTKSGIRLQSEWVRAAAQVLLEWYSASGLPPSSIALEANAHAMSLTSPDRIGQPLAPKAARHELGLPSRVQLTHFMEAAGRDALALALAVTAGKDDMSSVARRANSGKWALVATPLARTVGAARSTLEGYRLQDAYREIVTHFGFWTVLRWKLNGMAERMGPATPAKIAKRALRIPRSVVLAGVGDSDEFAPIELTPALGAAASERLRPLADAIISWAASAPPKDPVEGRRALTAFIALGKSRA